MFTWSSEEYCSRSFFGSGPSFLLNNFFYLTVVEEMVKKNCVHLIISSHLFKFVKHHKIVGFFPIYVCAFISMNQ